MTLHRAQINYVKLLVCESVAFAQALGCGTEVQHLVYGGTSVPLFEISVKRLLIKKLSMKHMALPEFELVKSRRCYSFVFQACVLTLDQKQTRINLTFLFLE